MGADLYRDEPVFRAAVDEIADLLFLRIGVDIRDIFDRNDTSGRIRDVAFAVPALFAISLGTARLLQSWGLTPTALLGHSLGECTAAAFTGALTLDDACTLVAARCTAAAQSAGVGGMMSVALSEHELRGILPDLPGIDLAAVNGPNSCVIAGAHDALHSADELLTDRGADVGLLRLDAAMHSRHVEAALGEVERAVRSFGTTTREPSTSTVFSTVTGDAVDAATLRAPSHWIDQLRSPVQFSRALTAAVTAAHGNVVVVEVGPGSSLTGLALSHGFDNAAVVVPTMSRDESESVTIRSAVGRLWSVGVPVDVTAVSGGTGPVGDHHSPARPIRAPGYRFDRRHLWIEPSDATSGSSAAFDDPLQIPLWRQLPPASISKTPHGTWAILDSSPAAQSLRNKFAELGVLVTEPEDNPTELHGVVTLAHAHDGPVDAVTSFSQAAGHLVPHVVDGGLWVSVTYNGSDPAHSGTVDPVAAAVRALPRVLGQESPGLRWAAVDLDIDIAHEEGADVVLSEIRDALGRSDTQPAPQVTVRAGTRWTSGTTSWSAAEPAAGVQPRTRALIVGGTGAVGRLLSDICRNAATTWWSPHGENPRTPSPRRCVTSSAMPQTPTTSQQWWPPSTRRVTRSG